ncbi:MAG: enolase C-terminal domain-like protein [Gemmatimonadota bacterium]|nr:enolase C-terminal domain-like protein [Gemmatimonadota bacterium]
MSGPALSIGVTRFLLPAGRGREAGPGPSGEADGTRLGVLVELRDGDGVSGWGEASPLPGYADETSRRAAAGVLAGAADPELRTRLARIASEEPPAATVARLPVPAGVPASARAALVCAALDLAGRRAGRPLRETLGAPGGAGRDVPVNALVSLADPRDAVTAGLAAVRSGLATIKAKLGPAERFEADLAALVALRGALGDGVALRLDANGLWRPEEAAPLLRRLADEVAPEYVEEPVPAGGLPALGPVPVPIAADESLRGPDATALLASGFVQVAVLKPGLLGGVDRCLDLARAAAEAGVRVVVTHAFEGPVGHAAACELALALAAGAVPGIELGTCGLAAHAALDAWPEVRVPQLRGDAVHAARVTGHGVDARPLRERAVGGIAR